MEGKRKCKDSGAGKNWSRHSTEGKVVMGLGESYRVVGKGKVAQDKAEEVKMRQFIKSLTDAAWCDD